MADSSMFRADHVGSLLRPHSVLEARRRFDAGTIGVQELREIEDEAIAEAVRRQLDSGIDVITDGEFRRKDFREGFVQAVEGISERMVDMPWRDAGGTTTALSSRVFTVTSRIRQTRRLAAHEAAYLQSLTRAPIKITLIAPGFLSDRFWRDGMTDEFYASREEFAAEVAAITRAEIEALLAEGVRYVQLDNPGYGAYLGEHAGHGENADRGLQRMIDADAAAVRDVQRPDGCTIGLHVCRGNQSSMHLGEGDYEPIAERLFSTVDVDRFLLEFDDERSGGLSPLRFIPKGRTVVLGLVSSKIGRLETVEQLRRRLDEATRYIDRDRLALSPQCGFASVALGGNVLTAEEQFAKLRLVADTALATWG